MRSRDLPNKHPQAHKWSSLESQSYEDLLDPLPLDLPADQEGYKAPHHQILPKKKFY